MVGGGGESVVRVHGMARSLETFQVIILFTIHSTTLYNIPTAALGGISTPVFAAAIV